MELQRYAGFSASMSWMRLVIGCLATGCGSARRAHRTNIASESFLIHPRLNPGPAGNPSALRSRAGAPWRLLPSCTWRRRLHSLAMRPATIIDVAKRAKVAVMTARKALNNDPSVRSYLLQRVQAAASDLDYQPNLMARGMKAGALRLITCSVTDIDNPFFSTLTSQLHSQLMALGYYTVLAQLRARSRDGHTRLPRRRQHHDRGHARPCECDRAHHPGCDHHRQRRPEPDRTRRQPRSGLGLCAHDRDRAPGWADDGSAGTARRSPIATTAQASSAMSNGP